MATLEQDGLPRTRELGRRGRMLIRNPLQDLSQPQPWALPRAPESHPPGKGLPETVLKCSPNNPDAHPA